MASIFDIFGGGSSLGDALGGMLGGGSPRGNSLGGLLGGGSQLGNSLGGLLGGSVGDVLNSLSSKARSAQDTFDSNITQKGGLGSLLGAGALGALLGNMAGGSLVKNAALLGAGAVALNFYKKWAESKQANNQKPSPDYGSERQSSPAAGAQAATNAALPQIDGQTLELITRAMVYAAKSDGKIDNSERECMTSILSSMLPGQNVNTLIQKVEKEEVDPGRIVEAVRSNEQGEDIYRLSSSVIAIDQFMERAYMDALAKALGISASDQKSIEDEAQYVHQQLVDSLQRGG